MAEHVIAAKSHVSDDRQSELRDAQMLRTALRASISTSPGAFLMTIEDLDDKDKEVDYWESQIFSSTWVVIQRGDEVVGLAVARWPDAKVDRGVDPAAARFIESVWIAPEFRRKRLAERLVKFLFEVECAQSPGVSQFLLWVFEKNHKAIRLYERMGFRYVARQELADQSGREELCYEFQPKTHVGEVQACLADRRDDLRTCGLVYRVLGKR
jgi:ribosomal protein S18 acetylase RimI-like enzyme